MESFIPRVKDVSLFKEIAQNLVNPLEVIREAISNSHDAEARTISIIISRNNDGVFVLEIQDDGKGINLSNIHRFFNLGDSTKIKPGIGEKGLGTKTYFKSKFIKIYTQTKDNEAYEVKMENPWENLCNNNLPQYTIKSIKPTPGRGGTNIIIGGYVVDNPEKYFNFETIKDYIVWFTAAGSFKTYFVNYTELNKYVFNMQIAPRVFLDDRILGIKEEISGIHPFYPPQENPKEDISEPIYKKSINYCRHFGPFHRATNINGQYVSFQMYGTISGVNCRRKIVKLRQGETIKSRFGIYLAKDFIPFTKRNNLIADQVYHHFDIHINSQSFELTADRNNLSNEDDPKIKWVLEESKKIISEEILPIAENGYFKLRKNEEIEYGITDKKYKLCSRLEKFDKMDSLDIREISIEKRPDNESQVALLFTALISNDNLKIYTKYINKIGHYSHQSTTDMICIDNNNKKVLVEIEHKLSSIFKHDHPYETFDYVVCWEVDLDINEKKKLRDGNVLALIKEDKEWILKYGTQKIIPIIELKTITNSIKEEKYKVLSYSD